MGTHGRTGARHGAGVPRSSDGCPPPGRPELSGGHWWSKTHCREDVSRQTFVEDPQTDPEMPGVDNGEPSGANAPKVGRREGENPDVSFGHIGKIFGKAPAPTPSR